MKDFYKLSIEAALKELKTQKTGLTNPDALNRKTEYGLNELTAKKDKPLLLKFLYQLKSFTVIILIIASVISGILGEVTDMAIILFVVLVNAVMGVMQEEKAEKALEALKNLSKPFASVLRENIPVEIKKSEIVPGDIVLLEAGDIVPADMRLIESASLRIDESALTGESIPSEKDCAAHLVDDQPIGDRINMAYSGCSVTYGRAKGVTTATGMDTEVGKIAGMIDTGVSEKTPLEKKLDVLGKYISIGVIIIAVIIFVVGIIGGRDPYDMFLTAIALAIAAIPEGLPAIVTIVLAIGVQKMAKRNAIIRKLPAVETLGGTQIICSDKTGTLTQNKMLVKEIFLNGIHFNHKANIHKDSMEFDYLSKIIILCNDASIDQEKPQGDPTETSLLEFGELFDYTKKDLTESYPRIDEIPFDSKRKLMTTVHNISGTDLSLTKGAPDVLIEKCDRILINEEIVQITDLHIKHIYMANDDMSMRALRVLGAAFNDNDQDRENNMIFVGLVAMMDPPREEAYDAVKKCVSAGILPIMITGDHAKTAYAIASELGIADDPSQVITGEEIDRFSEDEFLDIIKNTRVYARVSPEHKVKIVKAWKSKDMIVAMTGDGVNDAPALKIAHIGIGMGITGTEVSKSVSDVVLTDDNFATIVGAVEEGRKIFANIRKCIQYLLSANIGEVLALFIATLLNWTLLFPIHILWINLVTDTIPAIALGMEKAEKDIMKKPPESSRSFFTGGLTKKILYQGFSESILVLLVFMISRNIYDSSTVSITMAFVTLGLIQLFHAFNVRSDKSIFSIGFFSNKYLNFALLISAILQLSVVLLPFMNKIFKVTKLSISQWGICILASSSIILIVEMVKFISNISAKKKELI